MITLKLNVSNIVFKSDSNSYFDTNCSITLVDCNWLVYQLSNKLISKISMFLKIKSIVTFKYKISEYVIILLYFIKMQQDGSFVYTSIQHELYLVEGLKANIFDRNNILGLEKF